MAQITEPIKKSKKKTSKPLAYQSPENKFPQHVQLHLNENFQGPFPDITQVISSYNPVYSWRYPENGNHYLQNKIAKHYQINNDRVFINNGASAILEQIFRTFLKAQDKVLYPSPTWNFYHDSLVKYGVITHAIEMSISDSNFIVNEENFLSQIDKIKPDMIIFCSPNNPTGSRINSQFLLKACTKAQNRIVVLDEAYFGYTTTDFDFIKANITNLIIVRSFSKLYGLAGFRVGFGICHAQFSELLRTNTPSFGVSHLSQEVAAKALEYSTYYKRLAINLRHVLSAFCHSLNPKHWIIYETHSNFVLLKHYKFTGEYIANKVYHEGFIIKALSIQGDHKYIRVTIGNLADMQKLAKALSQLG